MIPSCRRCGRCCEVLAVPVPTLRYAPLEFLQYYEARGIELDLEASHILLPSRCPHLLPVNKAGEQLCDLHPHKPALCRDDTGPGVWHPPGCLRRTKR